MKELTQREILVKEENALQEMANEYQDELDILNANIEDVRKLIADFDAGLNPTPYDTYKGMYQIGEDNE